MATVDDILALFDGAEGNLPAGTPSKQGQRYGNTPHSTNASEQALTRQRIEAGDSDDPNNYEGSDGQLSDQMWKTIQQVDPNDGEKFYSLPGKQAMQTLGLKDGELSQFWDKLPPEDRYYLIKAIDSSAGMGSEKDLEEDVGRMKAEDDKDDVVKTIMQDDR